MSCDVQGTENRMICPLGEEQVQNVCSFHPRPQGGVFPAILSKSLHPGLYIHVPFCRTKCPYCDFYSVAFSSSLVSSWLDGIQKEILFYKDRFTAFDSLYLGGGTPSLLDKDQLSTLVHAVHRNFLLLPHSEITIEANPDDITPEKLALFRDLGFNRISLGAQSFDEQELRYLKRRHTATQTLKASEMIRSSGFSNMGMDLMYGFQGQTEAGWLKTMRQALEFSPEHLSCYQMTLEEGTPFGKMAAKGRITSLGEEAERAFFLLTSEFLEEQGYVHYEISNFARSENHTSRHNQKYWNHVPYLGLGPAAHSLRENVRWWNTRSVRKYCESLGNGRSAVEDSETLSSYQLRLESVYLGLRTKAGVDLETLGTESSSHRVLTELQKSGLLEIRNGRVIPTREGFLIADSLPLLFFQEEEEKDRES